MINAELPENDINYEPSLTVDSESDTVDPSSILSIEQQRQSNNNNPPVNNNAPVESVIVTESSSNNIAPPIDQGRMIKPNGGINNNQPDEQDNPNGSNEGDDDNISDFGDQSVQMTGRQRNIISNSKNYQWNQVNGNRNRNYYGYNTQQQQQQQQNRHHNPNSASHAVSLDEEDEFGMNLANGPGSRVSNSMSNPLDDDYLAPISSGRAHHPYNNRQLQYNKRKHPNSYFSASNNRQNRFSQRIQPNDILVKQTVVNLDHGVDDIINSPTTYDDSLATDQAPQLNNYGGQLYNEETFNHIHSPTRNRNIMQPSMAARGRQSQANLDRFRGYNNNNNNINRPLIDEAQASKISCGDCQSSTRRLGSKQFCHSEFAIKATILNKFTAEDWTKFEVEIQDIFKSPSLDYLNRNVVNGGSTNYVVDNMLIQSDEPILDRSLQTNTNNNNNSSGQVVLNEPARQQSLSHKIKVGTIQSIWVPTEDLFCKCPRLKLRATYLLMGKSINTQEHSINF